MNDEVIEKELSDPELGPYGEESLDDIPEKAAFLFKLWSTYRGWGHRRYNDVLKISLNFPGRRRLFCARYAI